MQVDASALSARVMRSFVVTNPAAGGIRVMIDIEFEKDKVGVIETAFKSGEKVLTEAWIYAWRFYDF